MNGLMSNQGYRGRGLPYVNRFTAGGMFFFCCRRAGGWREPQLFGNRVARVGSGCEGNFRSRRNNTDGLSHPRATR
jgi:hypothetical protein